MSSAAVKWLSEGLTFSAIGRMAMSVVVGAFVIGVIWTKNESDHADFRADLQQTNMQVSTNASQVAVATLQLQEVITEIKKDRELQLERANNAQRDRDRIQRTIEQYLDRVQ